MDMYTCMHCCLYFVHSDQKAKKGKEGRDPVDMVKFSKVKHLSLPQAQSPYLQLYIFTVLLYRHISTLLCVSPVSDPGVSDRLLRQRDE